MSTEAKFHSAYWVKFHGRSPACMEAPSEEEAKRDAAALSGYEVASIQPLPYPANPRLRPYVDPKYGQVPAFCWKPESCCGRSACPQNYSCTE